ncbi:uncharacterized protein [Dysidea avara]|uniref:uncharacterized protein n=1 Tax=Dysidea avara TaxID=196820 RepID=UPI0033328569
MNGAHFNLRSWASTSSQLIDQVSRDKISDTNNSVNILGLQWTTKADTLSLTSKSSIPSIASLITTSKVLKESSNVFDPLGLLSPVTVKVKIFMQSLWQCNLDWDELLSNEDQQQWLTYGAVSFLCSGNKTSFVMAKSRVASLKLLTLPKLEMMGALTAARLCDFIVQALCPLTLLTHFWSDSQITLHWIKGEKCTGTFVTHCVTEILNLSRPDHWQYCPTQDNPADLLTRGITSSQLKSSTLWKQGAQWLPSMDSWPTLSFSHTIEMEALAITTTSFAPSATQQTSGIDFTGALYACNNHIVEKVYICLFTCATNRAIYLEAITDLTTMRLLIRQLQMNFSDFYDQNILLRHWEAKVSFKKVLGGSRNSLVVLQTLIVEVDAILNDRPLTHVSSDLEHSKLLTPTHFLHGHRITSLPHTRGQLQAILLNQFQARWRFEYLTSVREYHRTTGNNSQRVKPGDIDLVYNDSPRNTWKLVIVEELMTGKDGLVSTPIVPETHGPNSTAQQETPTEGDRATQRN